MNNKYIEIKTEDRRVLINLNYISSIEEAIVAENRDRIVEIKMCNANKYTSLETYESFINRCALIK